MHEGLVTKFQTLTHYKICMSDADTKEGTNNYIPQYLLDVIACPCSAHLILAHKSPYIFLDVKRIAFDIWYIDIS